ncbi:galactokinase [Parafrankia sp. FMc2]|uniref:galactokinase n=1 Tax=Parafrankia sp. FMc2 TaxID=3233196 RepID=UPI0034D78B89
MTAGKGDAARRAVAAFTGAYGHAPAHVVRSPGRVNLIGEHTDYNDGLSMPAAINLELCLAFALSPTGTGGGCVHLVSEDDPVPATVSLPAAPPPPPGPPSRAAAAQDGWAGYVEGVVVLSAALTTPEACRGWRGAVASDLPLGAGLSSSAALELAVARACAHVWDVGWDPPRAAALAQQAENTWVGAATGPLDQLACAASVAGHALQIDFRDRATTPVPIPDTAALAIFDTGTRRKLVTSAYATRRADCERAAAQLRVASLRDVGAELPPDAARRLDPTALRRARHVVSDNQRVRDFGDALRRGDLARAGTVLTDGHRSLRDDFEVSSLALDAAVAASEAAAGCYGARMTGGGFAGCAIALVQAGSADAFVEQAMARYRARTGLEGRVYLCRPVEGTTLL